MKRFGAILSLALIVVMMASSFCFATDGFELNKTYPANGDTGKSIDNFGIKLYFNEPVLNEANVKANSKCIKVVDAEGETLPVTLYYSPKEEGLAMALVEPENTGLVKQDMEYTVTISGDFLSADGTALGKDTVVKFSTLNQTRASTINALLMAVMFGGMIIFTMRATKKQEEKKAPEKDQKVNPYKVSKETGKSVKEIVDKDQKTKAKRAASEAKKAAKEAKMIESYMDEIEDEPVVSNNKHVKGPRPISAGGSTYVSGRKALAEEARRKGTTNPKNKSKKNHK